MCLYFLGCEADNEWNVDNDYFNELRSGCLASLKGTHGKKKTTLDTHTLSLVCNGLGKKGEERTSPPLLCERGGAGEGREAALWAAAPGQTASGRFRGGCETEGGCHH